MTESSHPVAVPASTSAAPIPAASTTAPLLEIRDLGRKFGKLTAVANLSFSMQPGEIYGFIGPNGAGKTTTMRILATLDLPDTGDALVAGHSVLIEPRKVREQVGFMPDEFRPYANLNVMEYLHFFARAHGLKGEQRSAAVTSAAEFCGLMTFADRPTTGLSKGMGQRLHLAKTLLHDPSLLILDEPANGLDPRARIEFRELLRELREAGKSILISSHILSELSETCDGVIVIEKGREIVSGSIDSIAESMQGTHRAIRVRTLEDSEAVVRFLLTQPHVECVETTADRTVHLDFAGTDAELADLLRRTIEAKIPLTGFDTVDADLEDIFLRTTKGRLQ